jgi:hypothetical protein
MEEYSFKVKTCYCGADLSGLKTEATSYRYGTQPQAKCPNCGRDMLLDAPAIEPVIESRAASAAPARASAKKSTSTSK